MLFFFVPMYMVEVDFPQILRIPPNCCATSDGNYFLTGAYDKQLIMWDPATHQPKWSKTFEDQIQSVDFHPRSNGSNDLIALGMTNGTWVVLEAESQTVIAAHKDGVEQHDVIKYSPDGRYLMIGSHDNNLYLYKVSEDGRQYMRHGRCAGHSSYITHADWSKDSQFLQSNSGDYELLYWEAEGCRQVTQSSSLRDVEWDTQTCTLGFNVLGVWPEGADGTDINSVARSQDNTLLAAGDDFGKVHLFKYPAIQPISVSHSYKGHSSHVTTVQFLSGGNRLVSTGGQDCTAMQWALV
jgi:microtubule-associated protein-like 1/2